MNKLEEAFLQGFIKEASLAKMISGVRVATNRTDVGRILRPEGPKLFQDMSAKTMTSGNLGYFYPGGPRGSDAHFYISPNQSPYERLNTIGHELFHKDFPTVPATLYSPKVQLGQSETLARIAGAVTGARRSIPSALTKGPYDVLSHSFKSVFDPAYGGYGGIAGKIDRLGGIIPSLRNITKPISNYLNQSISNKNTFYNRPILDVLKEILAKRPTLREIPKTRINKEKSVWDDLLNDETDESDIN